MVSSLVVAAMQRCRRKEVWARPPRGPRRRAGFVCFRITNNPAMDQITAMRVFVDWAVELFAPYNKAGKR
jgi:hypothetical protein